MKNQGTFNFYAFVFIGICIITITGCKKDKDEKDDPVVPINLETVNIPPGTFTMGSPIEENDRRLDEAQHEVILSAFRMSKYAVTNAQFAAFLNNKKIGSAGIDETGLFPEQRLIYPSKDTTDWGLHFSEGKWVPVTGHENHPVVNVTWYGATAFADDVGGVLPTEAQWEYASRAGTQTPFYTGDCLDDGDANYNWNRPYLGCSNTITVSPGTTQAVGSYPPNAFGLYDMHGNVWQWCSDWYGEYPEDSVTDPTGPNSGNFKVVRGGSWFRHAWYCRSANRSYYYPFTYGHGLGFRVVFAP